MDQTKSSQVCARAAQHKLLGFYPFSGLTCQYNLRQDCGHQREEEEEEV